MGINANVTYTPNGQAVLVRSYYKNFGFQWTNTWTVLGSGQTIDILENTFNQYITHIKFADEWWNWNSNVYTLDHVFNDFWVVDTLTGLQIPGLPLAIYQTINADGLPAIGATWTPSAAPYFIENFPASPPDYWLQLP